MGLRDSPIIKQHAFAVRVRITEVSHHIAQGNCKTFDEYKKHCGVIRGLNDSLAMMEETIKSYTQGDEDDPDDD